MGHAPLTRSPGRPGSGYHGGGPISRGPDKLDSKLWELNVKEVGAGNGGAEATPSRFRFHPGYSRRSGNVIRDNIQGQDIQTQDESAGTECVRGTLGRHRICLHLTVPTDLQGQLR